MRGEGLGIRGCSVADLEIESRTLSDPPSFLGKLLEALHSDLFTRLSFTPTCSKEKKTGTPHSGI